LAAHRLADRLDPANVQKIKNAIPARLEYFEGQGFDLTPLVGCQVTAGSLSTFITAGVNASLAVCRSDKQKQVKQVVNPLRRAAKAFSRAEGAGVGTKKWTSRVANGEKMIGRARSKLTGVQTKLSPDCVGQLRGAIRTCLRP
jgi:hypothetical protein